MPHLISQQSPKPRALRERTQASPCPKLTAHPNAHGTPRESPRAMSLAIPSVRSQHRNNHFVTHRKMRFLPLQKGPLEKGAGGAGRFPPSEEGRWAESHTPVTARPATGWGPGVLRCSQQDGNLMKHKQNKSLNNFKAPGQGFQALSQPAQSSFPAWEEWGLQGVPGQRCSWAERQQPQHYFCLFFSEEKQCQQQLWDLGPPAPGQGGVWGCRAGRN